MKKFLQAITNFLNSIAEGRTAAAMARVGRYEDAARKIQSR